MIHQPHCELKPSSSSSKCTLCALDNYKRRSIRSESDYIGTYIISVGRYRAIGNCNMVSELIPILRSYLRAVNIKIMKCQKTPRLDISKIFTWL